MFGLHGFQRGGVDARGGDPGIDPGAVQAFEHEAEQQREETLRKYPREHWPDMTLEEYAQRQADHPENFCRWIERQTDQMGSIRGGSARKLDHLQAPRQAWLVLPERFHG